MKITAFQDGGRLTVRLSGELDHHAARGALAELGARIELCLPRECVMDMSELAFMDSSGIAVILKAYRQMREIRGEMSLENVPAHPMRVLRAAGIDRLMAVSPQNQEVLHNAGTKQH